MDPMGYSISKDTMFDHPLGTGDTFQTHMKHFGRRHCIWNIRNLGIPKKFQECCWPKSKETWYGMKDHWQVLNVQTFLLAFFYWNLTAITFEVIILDAYIYIYIDMYIYICIKLVCLSIYRFIFLSIYPSIRPSIYVFVYLYRYLSVSICVSVSICIDIHTCMYIYIYCICISLHYPLIHTLIGPCLCMLGIPGILKLAKSPFAAVCLPNLTGWYHVVELAGIGVSNNEGYTKMNGFYWKHLYNMDDLGVTPMT